jgi:hypothetical protein
MLQINPATFGKSSPATPNEPSSAMVASDSVEFFLNSKISARPDACLFGEYCSRIPNDELRWLIGRRQLDPLACLHVEIGAFGGTHGTGRGSKFFEGSGRTSLASLPCWLCDKALRGCTAASCCIAGVAKRSAGFRILRSPIRYRSGTCHCLGKHGVLRC